VFVGKGLLHRCDIGFLATQDIEPARRDLGLSFELLCLPQARAEFVLNLFEQRLGLLEIVGFLAIGDLLGGTFVRSRADVSQ
jgi:hypothetical protein